MNNPLNLQIIDFKSTLYNLESRFFRNAKANEMDLILYATENFLFSNCGELIISRQQEWSILYSKMDWLDIHPYSIEYIFENIIFIKNQPIGYQRAEPLINVFSSEFFTVLNGDIQLQRVTDSNIIIDVINNYPQGRILGFRM